ncbi:MAG: TetR/AcrR family transcriptional regulator [Actinomycetota bacterium]
MVETVKPTVAAATKATTKDRTKSRAETRREQRRALIIAAAEDELRESGIAGTTLAGVGERVGLSKGALYYYVDSRDALLALVLDDGLRAIRSEADRLAGESPTPLDELAAFGRAHVRCAVERPSGPLIVSNVDFLAAHDPTAELLHHHEEAAREIIARAVAAGQLRPVHPVVASSAFFGALNTLCRTFDPDGELGLDEMIDATLDLLVGGWAA